MCKIIVNNFGKVCLYWLSWLLDGDEAGGVVAPTSHARSAVLHELVGDRELAEVVASRLWMDFHLVEGLAIVDSHHAACQLGKDDQVLPVLLYHSQLLHGPGAGSE